MSLLLRLLINAVALLVAAWLVPGIRLGAAGAHPATDQWLTLALVALIFGLVNAFIRPIIVLLTLPLTILTLGLFIFIVNALMLLLTSGIAEGLRLGFRVRGFAAALLGSLIISVVNWALTHLLARRLPRR